MGTRENDDLGVLSLMKDAKLKPRLVFTLLLTGSFAGVWISHGGETFFARLFWWTVVVAVGVVAGGLYWRLLIFDPSSFDDSDAVRSVRSRWSRVEAVSVLALGLCGLIVLTTGASEATVGLVGTGFVVTSLLWLGILRVGDDRRRATRFRMALFGVALVSLCGFAWTETGTDVFDWVVRVAHLGSFALWIGGAVWHNFVVLPTVRNRPGAAKTLEKQARRFRRHLPVVIPLLFVTGGYQALRLLPLSPSSFVGSSVGRLVVLKLLILTVLTGFVVLGIRRSPAADRG